MARTAACRSRTTPPGDVVRLENPSVEVAAVKHGVGGDGVDRHDALFDAGKVPGLVSAVGAQNLYLQLRVLDAEPLRGRRRKHVPRALPEQLELRAVEVRRVPGRRKAIRLR